METQAPLADRITAGEEIYRVARAMERAAEAQIKDIARPLLDDLFAKLNITTIETERSSEYNDQGGYYIGKTTYLTAEGQNLQGEEYRAYLSTNGDWRGTVVTLAMCRSGEIAPDEMDMLEPLNPACASPETLAFMAELDAWQLPEAARRYFFNWFNDEYLLPTKEAESDPTNWGWED